MWHSLNYKTASGLTYHIKFFLAHRESGASERERPRTHEPLVAPDKMNILTWLGPGSHQLNVQMSRPDSAENYSRQSKMSSARACREKEKSNALNPFTCEKRASDEIRERSFFNALSQSRPEK